MIEVEIKNDVKSDVPIEFTVTDIVREGEAISESVRLHLLHNFRSICLLTLELKDYNGLATVKQLPTEQTIAGYYVILVLDDNLLEDKETFRLELKTDQNRVEVLPKFSQTVVTIYDDDSK